MRVIGGEFRSRLLKSVRGTDVRPTPDRLREALFNVLAPRIEKTVFADIYAGTGAVGIEALSRGAARAVFVECHRSALAALRANLQSLALADRAQVLQVRALAVLPTVDADMFFLDPPYRLEREYDAALDLLGTRALQLVVVQHDIRQPLSESYGALHQIRQLRQGDNVMSFYEPEAGCASRAPGGFFNPPDRR